MVPENLNKIASFGGLSPVVILLNVMANYQAARSGADDSAAAHTEALTTLFSSLEEIIAYGDTSTTGTGTGSSNSLNGIDVMSIVNSCVQALTKHSKIPEIVMSSLRLLSAITSFPQYRGMCLENDLLQAVNSIVRQYTSTKSTPDTSSSSTSAGGAGRMSTSSILDPIVNIYLNISSSEDDLAINLARQNSTKMIMTCIRQNLLEGGSGGTSGEGDDDQHRIETIISLLRILNRLSMLDEGANILKKQNCVSSLFDVLEFYSSSFEIQNLCLLTIQILMNEKDIEEILTRLNQKSDEEMTILFSLTEQSIERMEKVSSDIRRLGLLMLCGPEVIEQIETVGGIQLIQNFLIQFSPTVNFNVPENSLVSRARDELANCCIEALGRAALRNLDVEGTLAAIPLILQVAVNNPTPAVFQTMKTLCEAGDATGRVLSAIASGGGTALCLEICQATQDGGNYEPEVMASAFSLLSSLATDSTGLQMIVESHATDLICHHITESLMSEEEGSKTTTHSLESAVNVLQALSVYQDQHINYDAILKALSEVIESLASWTRDDGATTQYPDLLASTLSVVISLLNNSSSNSDEYATRLLESGDIAKLDRIMYAHDDMYLKYPAPTHALADMMCILINKNQTTNQFIQELGSQEYLLRTMNYHPADMSLQMKLANAIGGLGMDAALSGLFSFIEQVDQLTAPTSFSSDIIPQISQYVQLIGNLMLIDGALNPQIATHLFNTLLTACNCLLPPVDGGVQSERDEALYTTINCLAKLVAMESFDLGEEDLQRMFEFALVALRDCDAYQLQPDTKVVLLRIIRNLLEHRAKALEIALKINLFSTLQHLTPGTVLLALAANRRGADTSKSAAGKVTNVITAQTFTSEQNQTLDLLLKKLIDSISHLDYLPYRGVVEMCEVMCAQNTQNPGEIHWKLFLDKLLSHGKGSSGEGGEGMALFGYPYLLDLLSELRSPYSPYASLRSVNIVNNLIKAISEKLMSGIIHQDILSFDQQSHQDAVISTSLHLLSISPTTNTSLYFLDCLANTPAGAYAILQCPELIQHLITSMKSSSTSLHASTIIVKIASHEIEGTMKLLIDHGLTKQILSSLKSSTSGGGGGGELDESYIQNAVYLLRVFADSIGITELRLPKETIKIMAELTLKFSSNEYLTSVAGSISSDLSEAFAIGPEAQLESQLNLFVNYVGNAAAGGGNMWQQLVSEPNATPYFYNPTTGASQWEEPPEYQTQLHVIEDFIELLTQKLNCDLSDVALSESNLDSIYSMLYNSSGDKKITNQLMQFVYAQVDSLYQTPSSPLTLPVLLLLVPTDCKEQSCHFGIIE
jgi:hypothetical protein